MGQGGSKEVVIAGAAPPPQPPAAVAPANREFRDAEEAIFREGFRRGYADALAKADSEVERQARAAFALAALDDEVQRSRDLEGTLSRLQSSQYKAPSRPLQCDKEELALSVCGDSSLRADCRLAVRAYTACADRLVQDVILPFQGKALK